MCLNKHWIYNHYSGKKVLVDCGKCDACLQKKANARTRRIKNNYKKGYISLFVTLTYASVYLPYIRKSDIFEKGSLTSKDIVDIPVYRNASARFTYSRYKGYGFNYKEDTQVIQRVPLDTEIYPEYFDPNFHARGLSPDCFGVCLNSDFQKFIKRLSIILQRHYEIPKTLWSYFYCSEYGSHTRRPHFHALIFIPQKYEKSFRSAIVKAWPYHLWNRQEKQIQIAADAASYCSSYVNSGSHVYDYRKIPAFRSSHHYSQGFGLGNPSFSLPSILAAIDNNTLTYRVELPKAREGRSFDVRTIPFYAFSRFFPNFKGHFRLDKPTLERLLQSPIDAQEVLTNSITCLENDTLLSHPTEQSSFSDRYNYTPKECYKIYVRLENAYQKFYEVTGLSRQDYSYYYIRCYQCYATTNYRLLHEKVESPVDYGHFYDNISEFYDMVDLMAVAPTLDYLTEDSIERDPNQRSWQKQEDTALRFLFSILDKQKKVSHFVQSTNNIDV